ncbi:MAG: hypothetical protein ACLFUX_07940 [Spirochaetaceae bacterium]
MLLAESCTHYTHSDDIADYALVIHCGACMLTRRIILTRLDETAAAGVPVTNYGVAISHLRGLLDRVLVPFRDELV